MNVDLGTTLKSIKSLKLLYQNSAFRNLTIIPQHSRNFNSTNY